MMIYLYVFLKLLLTKYSIISFLHLLLLRHNVKQSIYDRKYLDFNLNRFLLVI